MPSGRVSHAKRRKRAPNQHPRAKTKRAKTKPVSAWEPYRNEIVLLHQNRGTLQGIQRHMSQRHGFEANKRQYVHRFKQWGLTRYNKTASDAGDYDSDGEERDDLPEASQWQQQPSPSDSSLSLGISSECGSDPSEVSRQFFPTPMSVDPPLHAPLGFANDTRSEYGAALSSRRALSYIASSSLGGQGGLGMSSLEKNRHAAELLFSLSYHEIAFELLQDCFQSRLTMDYHLPTPTERSLIATCVRSASNAPQQDRARDMLRRQIQRVQGSMEEAFYKQLDAFGFRPLNLVREPPAEEMHRETNNAPALANASQSPRSIDVMGYLLRHRNNISQYAKMLNYAADGPLLWTDLDNFSPDLCLNDRDLLLQYVARQPISSGVLEEYDILRDCVVWCRKVLQHDLADESCAADMRRNPEYQGPKRSTELFHLLWCTLYTNSLPPWASNSERDVGMSPSELLSIVCRLILPSPEKAEISGNEKGKARCTDDFIEMDTFGSATLSIQQLQKLDNQMLWQSFLDEFLVAAEECPASWSPFNPSTIWPAIPSVGGVDVNPGYVGSIAKAQKIIMDTLGVDITLNLSMIDRDQQLFAAGELNEPQQLQGSQVDVLFANLHLNQAADSDDFALLAVGHGVAHQYPSYDQSYIPTSLSIGESFNETVPAMYASQDYDELLLSPGMMGFDSVQSSPQSQAISHGSDFDYSFPTGVPLGWPMMDHDNSGGMGEDTLM